jgi:hypothetical protein
MRINEKTTTHNSTCPLLGDCCCFNSRYFKTFTMSNYQKTSESIEPFDKVDEPMINSYYHLSWAYKGARFCLTKINNDGTGEVWTGKTKNKYFPIKLDDLRKCRK